MPPPNDNAPPEPRYLIPFDSSSIPHLFTNVLVIGSGVGGLRAAIEAGQHTDVVVVGGGAMLPFDQAAGRRVAVKGLGKLAGHAAPTKSCGQRKHPRLAAPCYRAHCAKR